jgi:hypothetical protein
VGAQRPSHGTKGQALRQQGAGLSRVDAVQPGPPKPPFPSLRPADARHDPLADQIALKLAIAASTWKNNRPGGVVVSIA